MNRTQLNSVSAKRGERITKRRYNMTTSSKTKGKKQPSQASRLGKIAKAPFSVESPERHARLSQDVARAARTLGESEVRFLVDYYYELQEDRKRSGNQLLALAEAEEPHELIRWLYTNVKTDEDNIKKSLTLWLEGQSLAEWCQSIRGIGPVISAGLMANIDITKAPTVGHIWRFAGLDPTLSWEKKTKRPWNARLKTLCWKIGESFVKTCNFEDSFYGPLYVERKVFEEARNVAGYNKTAAAEKLAKYKIGKDTDAYKAYSKGKLPPAHIHSRAKRWAVKLFLAHYHHVAYEIEYKTPPPKPYILTQENHVHEIAPPNWG